MFSMDSIVAVRALLIARYTKACLCVIIGHQNQKAISYHWSYYRSIQQIIWMGHMDFEFNCSTGC